MTLPFTNATSSTPLPTAGVTATSEGGSSFAKVLKQQGDNTPAPAKPAAQGKDKDRPAARADAPKPPAQPASPPAKPAQAAGQDSEAGPEEVDLRQAEAAAALALAQAVPALPAPTLPQQALEIAAQVAEVQAPAR